MTCAVHINIFWKSAKLLLLVSVKVFLFIFSSLVLHYYSITRLWWSMGIIRRSSLCSDGWCPSVRPCPVPFMVQTSKQSEQETLFVSWRQTFIDKLEIYSFVVLELEVLDRTGQDNSRSISSTKFPRNLFTRIHPSDLGHTHNEGSCVGVKWLCL